MTVEQRKDKPMVRPMEPEDIDATLEIDRKISGQRRFVTYSSLLTGDLGGELDLSFVAEMGNRVVGFVLARRAYIGEPVIEVGLIQILGVDPDYWRQGIATQLVDAMLEKCKTAGLNTVRTMINARDSELQRFFVTVGFERGQLIDYTRLL